MEGDALVKELTGARVMAMEQDVPALQKMTPGGKPHPIDRVLHDGDRSTLGGTTLVAHLTPGHTKGCTTWTTEGHRGRQDLRRGDRGQRRVEPRLLLVNNKDYPQIADDYVRSFATLRKLPCDIFLAAHGSFYDLETSTKSVRRGGANPFIDHAGYLAYIDLKEKQFNAELERQKNGGKPWASFRICLRQARHRRNSGARSSM